MRKWPSASETTYFNVSKGIYVTVQLSEKHAVWQQLFNGVKHCLYKSYKYLINGESHFISHYWLDFVRASERASELWILTIVQLKKSISYIWDFKLYYNNLSTLSIID